jgi:hypothetical protein
VLPRSVSRSTTKLLFSLIASTRRSSRKAPSTKRARSTEYSGSTTVWRWTFSSAASVTYRPCSVVTRKRSVGRVVDQASRPASQR